MENYYTLINVFPLNAADEFIDLSEGFSLLTR